MKRAAFFGLFGEIYIKRSNREPGIPVTLVRGGKANGGFNRRETILLISNHGDNPFREKLCVPTTTKNVVSCNRAVLLPKEANK